MSLIFVKNVQFSHGTSFKKKKKDLNRKKRTLPAIHVERDRNSEKRSTLYLWFVAIETKYIDRNRIKYDTNVNI